MIGSAFRKAMSVVRRQGKVYGVVYEQGMGGSAVLSLNLTPSKDKALRLAKANHGECYEIPVNKRHGEMGPNEAREHGKIIADYRPKARY